MEERNESFVALNTLDAMDLYKEEILSSYILILNHSFETIIEIDRLTKEVTVIQEHSRIGISGKL